MNPAFTNLGFMLVMMQVSRRLDLEDPTTLSYVRAGYLACQFIAICIYGLTKYKIQKKNDLTTMKYVENPSPFSSSEPTAIVTTVKEYDIKQVDQQVKSLFTSLLMMSFMHLYLKFTNPLVMQSLSAVKSALESNIVKIHLFGSPATGELKRPFKAAPGIMQALSGAQGFATDKHSVSSVEANGAGGIKED